LYSTLTFSNPKNNCQRWIAKFASATTNWKKNSINTRVLNYDQRFAVREMSEDKKDVKPDLEAINIKIKNGRWYFKDALWNLDALQIRKNIQAHSAMLSGRP
jgi:hypothetical protein